MSKKKRRTIILEGDELETIRRSFPNKASDELVRRERPVAEGRWVRRPTLSGERTQLPSLGKFENEFKESSANENVTYLRGVYCSLAVFHWAGIFFLTKLDGVWPLFGLIMTLLFVAIVGLTFTGFWWRIEQLANFIAVIAHTSFYVSMSSMWAVEIARGQINLLLVFIIILCLRTVYCLRMMGTLMSLIVLTTFLELYLGDIDPINDPSRTMLWIVAWTLSLSATLRGEQFERAAFVGHYTEQRIRQELEIRLDAHEMAQSQRGGAQLDMTSPLQRIVSVLGVVATNPVLPRRDVAALQSVVELLVTQGGNMLKPDVQAQLEAQLEESLDGPNDLDAEVAAWMLHNLASAPGSYDEGWLEESSTDKSGSIEGEGTGSKPSTPSEEMAKLSEDLVIEASGGRISGNEIQAVRAQLRSVGKIDDKSSTLPAGRVLPSLPDRKPVDEDALKELMRPSKVIQWEFDCSVLKEITHGQPLYYMAMWWFDYFDLLGLLGVSRERFGLFLRKVEKGYHVNNPFHNSLHAADVVHACGYFLASSRVRARTDERDILATMLAAVLHDVDHPGTSNRYQIQAQTELAVRYNDQSVLEQHHCSKGWQLIVHPDYDILSNLTKDTQRWVRTLFVDLILATDLQRHYEYLSLFKAKMTSGLFPNVKSKDKEDIRLMLKVLIKSADVCNSAKRQELCMKWSGMCQEEFYRQGDLERQQHFSISPFMDRRKAETWPKCQVTFIKFMVGPLYEQWCAFLKRDEILETLNANRAEWERQQKVEESKAPGSKAKRRSHAHPRRKLLDRRATRMVLHQDIPLLHSLTTSDHALLERKEPTVIGGRITWRGPSSVSPETVLPSPPPPRRRLSISGASQEIEQLASRSRSSDDFFSKRPMIVSSVPNEELEKS